MVIQISSLELMVGEHTILFIFYVIFGDASQCAFKKN